MKYNKANITLLLAFAATTLLGFINAQAVGSKDLFRCRQSCYQKFVRDWHHCMDFEDCKNMCITPPNINSYIPEAFSFLCWNNCDQQLGPFPLNINSALRQGSLVLTDIGWDQAIANASKQCLVTWEVSGGGLMGNLLTDSSTVELSLWPDTVYHVQVTCKHKETGGMRRSYKLIVDTHKLSADSTASGMQAIAMDTGDHLYASDAGNSEEADSRMRILKDSSKDFLTPYNPHANSADSGKHKPAPPSTSSTSSTLSSSSSSSSSSSHSESTEHENSVLRTRLVAAPPAHEAVSFVTQSVVCAVVGSAVLFLGLLVLCVLTRSARKELLPTGFDGASAIDKEVLIRTEMLPSQTLVAACGVTTPAPAVAALSTTPSTRTLHV